MKKVVASVIFLALFAIALLPQVSFAISCETDQRECNGTCIDKNTLCLNLSYPSFGGFNLKDNQNLVQILGWLYYAMISISGLAAFAMLVWGGVQWLTSSGNPGQIGDARDKITQALLGLAIVLGSYLIVGILNPELLLIQNPTPKNIPATPISPPKESPTEALKDEIKRRFGITMVGFDETHLVWAKNAFERIRQTRFFHLTSETVVIAQSGGSYSSFQKCREIFLDQYNPEEFFSVILIHELSHVVEACNQSDPDRAKVAEHRALIAPDASTGSPQEGLVTRYAENLCKDTADEIDTQEKKFERQRQEDYAEMLTYYLNPDAMEQTASIPVDPSRPCEAGGPNPYKNRKNPLHLELAKKILNVYITPGKDPIPGLTINGEKSVSVLPEQKITLAWDAVGATSCTAATDKDRVAFSLWKDKKGARGKEEIIMPSAGVYTFTLLCHGSSNTERAESVTAVVTARPPLDETPVTLGVYVLSQYDNSRDDRLKKAPSEGPACSVPTTSSQQNPCLLVPGQGFFVQWASTPKSNQCEVQGPMLSRGGSSGSMGPVTFSTSASTMSFTVTCTNPANGKSASDAAFVRLDEQPRAREFFDKPKLILEEGAIKKERVGTTALLRVQTRFDPGTTISFNIYEYDIWPIPDDTIRPRKGADTVEGNVNDQGVAEATWTITEGDMKAAGDDKDFQFYFTASYQGVTSASHSDYLTIP